MSGRKRISVNLTTKINIHSTIDELSAAAAGHVALLAARATEKRDRFTVALSGGSLIEILSERLIASPFRAEVNWPAWHVFWADERCVPWSSSESNYGVADRLLFRHISIPRNQIHALDDALDGSEAAETYESTLRQVFRPRAGELPRFDLILLGIGEDGHTASLFPHHPLLKETQRWVAPMSDAPKPPPVRVTLTLPVINNARHVVFVAAGSRKRSILSEVLEPGSHRPRLPAGMVNPSDGDLQWFVDAAAASSLRKPQGSEQRPRNGAGLQVGEMGGSHDSN
jgi:6-phosphogluconolactonase